MRGTWAAQFARCLASRLPPPCVPPVGDVYCPEAGAVRMRSVVMPLCVGDVNRTRTQMRVVKAADAQAFEQQRSARSCARVITTVQASRLHARHLWDLLTHTG